MKKAEFEKPFISILMPPPNVTGQLHLGHALNNYIQDTIIRFHKLRNVKTIWVPGFDHAGIATEILVKNWIQKNHLKIENEITKKSLFVKWSLAKQEQIRQQWKELNLAINSEYESFTLNPAFADVVKSAFVKLYNKKLIYQKQTLVNWDPKLKTVIADIEVEHKSTNGKLYFVRYYLTKPIEQTTYITVATTRPETIFADQALVINPNDQRYQHLLKATAINPLTNQNIPIISDPSVDIDFGTGILKCTPGHDFADWKIGNQHQLKIVSCLTISAKLNELGLEFAGLDRFRARTAVIAKLKNKQLLSKTVDYQHNVPYSSRSGAIIEPLLSKQWFIKTEQWGQKILTEQTQIHFEPAKYHKYLINWVLKMHDWCISRQLSWGHRLPVYFHHQSGKIKVTSDKLDPKIWTQSTDVLDTWFSSGLWAIGNFGWNNPSRKTLENYFPISYLVTSYDIIFFWVVKMLFFSLEFKQQIPFKKIIIHGLIRNKNHQKMSKSRGNVVNPIALIHKYSSDALRINLLTNYKIGDDVYYEENKVEQAQQLIHKMHHIQRFLTQFEWKNIADVSIKHPLNLSMLNQIQIICQTYEMNFNNFQWTILGDQIINFIWKEFSNFYLLYSKTLLTTEFRTETLLTTNLIWKQLLQLFYPFMPETSAQLFSKSFQTNILKTKFKINLVNQYLPLQTNYQVFVSILKQILQFKKQTSNDAPTKLNQKIIWNCQNLTDAQNMLTLLNILLKKDKLVITKLQPAKVNSWQFLHKVQNNQQLIQTKIKFYRSEVKRSEKLLANQNFLAKADSKIVAEEKIKYQKYCNNLLFWQKKIKN